jgi:hypothetical protein
MANADSASNMLWLINQATAGEITNSGQAPAAAPAAAADKTADKPERSGVLSASAADTSFNNFKIDMNA